MLNVVYCEMLKMKRSKIVVFSVLGVLATPLMMLIEALQTHFQHPEKFFTLSDVYDSSLLYVMLLMNMMVYVAITAYLFSREYTEKTLKTVLPVPVSRVAFTTGKFLMLLIWTTVLTLLTWAAILILMAVYHVMFGLEGFATLVAGEWLIRFLPGSVLMFLTISPFAYIAQKTKGFVVPVIICAAVVMGSAAICNQEFGALYPWTAGYFLIEGRIYNTPYPVWSAIASVLIVAFVGYFSTFRYFCREDIK